MKEDATFKAGKFTVHVDYYEGYGDEYCNSIHVSAAVNGKSYWADISELTCQSNEDGSKWVVLDENEEDQDNNPLVKMTAAQWNRIKGWLIAEEHGP
tara:strand:+ start:853 stop:1143 length:291 start_codon:yes stop_codon:yes gene_type:complete